ncbi:unnamed protein product, partial [Ectocarpus sp. 12 AP-2014]
PIVPLLPCDRRFAFRSNQDADDAFLERPWSFGYEDKWDAFMRRASHEFAAKVPYMVVPGNHEAECHSPACLSSPRRLNV